MIIIKNFIDDNFTESQIKIFKNLYSLTFGQLLKFFFNLFISVYIARYLGLELLGKFSYIVAVTGILGSFSALGLQSIVVRELVKTPKKSSVILGTSLTLSFIASFFSYGLLVLIILFSNPNDKMLLILAFINGFTFLFETLRILSFYYESKVNSTVVVRYNNISLIISSILKVIVVYFDLGIYLLTSIYVFEIAFTGLLLFKSFSKNVYSLFKFSFDYSTAKNLLRDSLPLLLSGFMIGIFMKIDQIMINNMLGSSELGQYSIAAKLTELFYFIPVIIQSTLFPGIESAKNDKKLFRKRLNNLYSMSIIIAYIVILFMTFSSDYIIDFLYGPEFSGAKAPLLISIWAFLFVSYGISRNAFIISNNLTLSYMIIMAISAIINISVNLILIPKYGIIGASFATVLSQIFAGVISSLFYKPLRQELFNSIKLFVIPKINFKVF